MIYTCWIFKCISLSFDHILSRWFYQVDLSVYHYHLFTFQSDYSIKGTWSSNRCLSLSFLQIPIRWFHQRDLIIQQVYIIIIFSHSEQMILSRELDDFIKETWLSNMCISLTFVDILSRWFHETELIIQQLYIIIICSHSGQMILSKRLDHYSTGLT